MTTLDIGLEIGADLHRGDWGHHGWNPEGIDGEGPWREPRMSHEVADKLFAEFVEEKKGEPLKKVTFTVGDIMKPNLGPLYAPSWEEGRARRFKCKNKQMGGGNPRTCEETDGDDADADSDADSDVDEFDEEVEILKLQAEMVG